MENYQKTCAKNKKNCLPKKEEISRNKTDKKYFQTKGIMKMLEIS